jgi:hypothetical protein
MLPNQKWMASLTILTRWRNGFGKSDDRDDRDKELFTSRAGRGSL